MAYIGRFLLLLIANLAVAALCEGGYRAWLYLQTPRPDPTVQRFELYGVGESTLIGEPFDPKISIPRLLIHMFDGRIAGRPIVLKNLAERGVSLYPQALEFERAMASRDAHAPGVVLVISGHNEAIDPSHLGAEDTFVPSLLAEHSAIVRDMLLALRRRRIAPREKTLAAYEHDLRLVIETAQRHGLVPIVATMASNITRVEPNYDGPGEAVQQTVVQGVALEDEGRWTEARDLYTAALRGLDRNRAPLSYRAGRCEEALGNYAAASEDYWSAVDQDPRTMFGRATRIQNELVRSIAREYGVPLVDAVAIFARQSPHGIPAAEFFADAQHPSLAGYFLLADAYAAILSQRFDTPIVHHIDDASETAAALDFDSENLRESMIDAGSWLIAASVDHPLPRDRMNLAAALFESARGKGDDFSAWLGLGLAQAARYGGLRSADPISSVCRFGKSYRLSPEEGAAAADRLQALGVDAEIVHQVRVLSQNNGAW